LDGQEIECPTCGGTGTGENNDAPKETQSRLWTDEEWRAEMSTAAINDLPDSDFAYIESGGEKDEEGKTTPRSLRHYPIQDAAHVRNALARAAAAIAAGGEQANIAEKAMPAIKAAAKKMGIGDEKKAADDSTECSTCGGTGKIMDGHRQCPDCGGTGVMETKASFMDLEHRKAFAEGLLQRGSAFERRHSDNGPLETRTADKSDDGMLHISGYGSVFDRPYDMGFYNETVKRGALKKSLAEGAQVHLLSNHTGLPLSSTVNGSLSLREDNIGLHFDAALDPDDPDSAAVFRKVQKGLLRECSFAFRTVRQDWNPDYTERTLTELSIDKGDVSVVNWGANPATSVEARALSDQLLSTVRQLITELRAGKSISAANSAQLQTALDALHTADDADIPGIVRSLQEIDKALDDAQGAVSTVLGVKDPDGDPKDLEPTLSSPLKEKEAKSVVIEPDIDIARRLAQFEALRHAPRLDVA
jgi:hypothetical protein